MAVCYNGTVELALLETRMTKSIEAVYEGGYFRPVGKISPKEGTRVEVLITQPDAPRDAKAVAAKLAQVASKAAVGQTVESTSLDHDKILYGGKSQP